MKLPLLFSVIAACSLFDASLLRADDSAIARQLEALGGKVTQKDGAVSQITFTDSSKLGDAEFRAIGQLSHLKSLTLYGSCRGLTDATLPHFAGLKELETLGTDGAQLTDAGLKHLTALTNLRGISFFHLSFRMEGFTGTGLGHLRDCPKLERLTVAGMSMGDEGFAAISTVTQLRELATWHTYQTEAGNAHIAKLPHLTKLQIGQRLPRPMAKAPSLSDASIPTLTTIASLESLKIGEARFTLAALRGLKALPKLKLLTLHETDLPAADVEALQAELPGVKIVHQPLTDEQRKKLEMYLKQ
jgi:hypothetical protein